MTSVQRFFQSESVVKYLLTYLDDNSLKKIARVKGRDESFCRLVADVEWETLGSLDPVLKLLPDRSNDEQMLDGPPDAHWVRHVARCVERVRRLKIPNGGWSLLALVEEHERHGVNLPQPLFRNLQELEVGIWTDEQQNTFGYLVSRSLRSLHLEISPRSGITNFEPLIQALSNHKAISLRLDHDSDALPKDFLTGVAKFASLSLSHIDTTEPLFAAMIHRARSRQYHVPYCTSVFIRHHEVDIALPHPQHFRPNNIGGDRLPFWTPILQDDNVWHVLRDIKIHQRQDIPVQYSHFVEFMHALGDKNSLESVEILNVEIIVTPNKKSGESPPALWPISFGIKLAKLIIETRGDFPDLSYSMTQDDLEFSFRSHKLEVFRIVKPNEDASNSAAPRLGLEAISWLINQNPKLHTLALSVDAMSTLYVPPPSPNKALRSLDFGRSWIDSPAEVASWLGEACVGDGLTWMQARSPLDELRATKWRKVKAIIQKQQKARRASQPGFVQLKPSGRRLTQPIDLESRVRELELQNARLRIDVDELRKQLEKSAKAD